ncbi:MAG: hypothetical protein EAY75_06335 [Bacteroidetes bacterium]|nr:MAG: hypothetical protein EAY75_06335 [Bacteroidota bacterium]
MSNVLEFLVKLQDLVSAPLNKVSASFGAAQAKAKEFNRTLHHTGGGVSDLRASLERLRNTCDLIHPSNTA